MRIQHPRAIRIAKVSAAIWLTTQLMQAGSAQAQPHRQFGNDGLVAAPISSELAALPNPPPPDPVRVEMGVQYVNDWWSGYDEARHTYRHSWLDEVLFDPDERPIRGYCSMDVAEVEQDLREDFGSCGTIPARLAPEGAVALRWRLTDEAALAGQTRILDESIRELGRIGPIIGSDCVPQSRPVVVSDEDCIYEVMAPTESQTSLPADYTIHMDFLGVDGAVVREASRAIVVPRSAPLIVSVGDSLASGEGNPDQVGIARGDGCAATTLRKIFEDAWGIDMIREPQWFDERDHRSLMSAPARGSRGLLTTWPYVVFLSVAKSGSGINEEGPPTDDSIDVIEQLAQVDRMIGDYPIDVLLITVGMNDINFSGVIEELAKDNLDRADALEMFIPRRLRLRGEIDPDQGYPALAAWLEASRLNIGQVLITEYPNYLFNDAGNQPIAGCGLFELGPGDPDDPLASIIPSIEIDAAEASALATMGLDVNEEIEVAANEFGWRVVDGIDELFVGHGYCSGQSFFVFAEDSCRTQGDFEGLVHPNLMGTYRIGLEIEAHLREVLGPPPTQDEPVLDADPVLLSRR